MRIRRNVAAAVERTMALFVRDAGGSPVLPGAITVADLLYDPGTGVKAAAGGTLVQSTRPLVYSDATFTTTHATETVNLSLHDLLTGDGPFTVSNSGGALPTGYVAATNYWWIKVDDDHGKLAASLANALSNTPVTISSDGTGTHTISDTPSTRRHINGDFVYTFTQAETNVTAPFISIAVDSPAAEPLLQTADVYLREMDEIHTGAYTKAEIDRLMLAVLAGPASGFLAGTIVFKDPLTGTVRLTATVIPDGRSAPTFLIGDLS